jgi:hypothetical protein
MGGEAWRSVVKPAKNVEKKAQNSGWLKAGKGALFGVRKVKVEYHILSGGRGAPCLFKLGNHAGGAPTLHGWVEIKLEEMLESDYVDRSLVVGAKGLYAGRHNNVNPRLEHRLQISESDFFVNRRQKKPEAPSSLGHNLPPTFPKGSLNCENDRIRRILVKIFD